MWQLDSIRELITERTRGWKLKLCWKNDIVAQSSALGEEVAPTLEDNRRMKIKEGNGNDHQPVERDTKSCQTSKAASETEKKGSTRSKLGKDKIDALLFYAVFFVCFHIYDIGLTCKLF